MKFGGCSRNGSDFITILVKNGKSITLGTMALLNIAFSLEQPCYSIISQLKKQNKSYPVQRNGSFEEFPDNLRFTVMSITLGTCDISAYVVQMRQGDPL